jgi:hypothetical protein
MRQVASVMGLFTSSDFFFAAAQRAERLKIAFQAVAPPPVAVLCSEAGRPFFVPSLAFRTPEHAEGRWTARRAFLQTVPAIGIRSVIFVNVSRRRVQASVRGRRKVAHLMRSDGRVSRSRCTWSELSSAQLTTCAASLDRASLRRDLVIEELCSPLSSLPDPAVRLRRCLAPAEVGAVDPHAMQHHRQFCAPVPPSRA